MPDGSNLDAHQIDTSDPSAHAVEFSKTAAPSREGDSFADGAPERDPLRAGLVSIAPIRRPEGPAAGANPTGRGRIALRRRVWSGGAPRARGDAASPLRSARGGAGSGAC